MLMHTLLLYNHAYSMNLKYIILEKSLNFLKKKNIYLNYLSKLKIINVFIQIKYSRYLLYNVGHNVFCFKDD